MTEVTFDDVHARLSHVMRNVTVQEETRPVPLDPKRYWYPIQALGPSHVGHQLIGRTISGTALCGSEVVTSDWSMVHHDGEMPRFGMCPKCVVQRSGALRGGR